jgi:hypothetical protein
MVAFERSSVTMARPHCVAHLRAYLMYVFTLAFSSARSTDDSELIQQFVDVTHNTIHSSIDPVNAEFPSMPSRRAPAAASNHLQSTFDPRVDAMLFRSQHRPIIQGLTVSVKLDTRRVDAGAAPFDPRHDAYFDLARIACVLNSMYEPGRSTDLYVHTPTCTVTIFPCGTFLVMNAPVESDAWFAIDLVKTAIEQRVGNQGLSLKLSPTTGVLSYDKRTAKRHFRYKYCIGTHASTYRVQLGECLKTCYGLRGAVEMCSEISAGLIVRIAQYKTNFLIHEHIIMAYTSRPHDMATAFETIIAPAIEHVHRAQASRL